MHTKRVTGTGAAYEPGRVVRRGMPRAAALAVAVAVSLVACGGPQVSVTPGTTLASPAMATPGQTVDVPWPTLAAAEASVPSSLAGRDVAFWRLDERVPCCGASLRISTSLGSGNHLVDVPPASMSPEFRPVPAGPARGRVVYVVDDGRSARLMVTDARTGASAELLSTSLLITRLELEPGGSTAYYLLVDRRTSALAGVWALPIDGGAPRPLIAVDAAAGMATLAVQGSPAEPMTLAAERVYPPQLAVSTDGRWIVFVTCEPTGCQVQLTHPDGTGPSPDPSNFHVGDSVVGIAGDLLVGATECPQATCDGFVLDLRSGERWPLGGTDRPFAPRQLIAGPHGPLVLGESADHERGLWQVEELDLTDGRRSIVLVGTFEPGVGDVHLAEGRDVAGAELPPGWFLIYRNADPAAALPPDYSAGTVGAAVETALPFMDVASP